MAKEKQIRIAHTFLPHQTEEPEISVKASTGLTNSTFQFHHAQIPGPMQIITG